jgi:hypothetical protein
MIVNKPKLPVASHASMEEEDTSVAAGFVAGSVAGSVAPKRREKGSGGKGSGGKGRKGRVRKPQRVSKPSAKVRENLADKAVEEEREGKRGERKERGEGEDQESHGEKIEDLGL